MKEMDGGSYALFIIGTAFVSGSAGYYLGFAATFLTTGITLILLAILLGEHR